MATTYLSLVNDVLARLRESQVVLVNQNTYSTLIGKLINDAKREVEDAWNWSVLRTTVTVTTAADDYTYSLTDAGNRMKIQNVYDDTNNAFLEYRSKRDFIDAISLNDDPQTGKPAYYTIDGVDANGDLRVQIYPIPDAAYSIKFDIINPEAELSEDTDTTALPKTPIVALAWAKAIEERGEDGGINVSSQYGVAKQALGDAIAIEAGRRDDEITWYPQ
jgi:hypothetical protein